MRRAPAAHLTCARSEGGGRGRPWAAGARPAAARWRGLARAHASTPQPHPRGMLPGAPRARAPVEALRLQLRHERRERLARRVRAGVAHGGCGVRAGGGGSCMWAPALERRRRRRLRQRPGAPRPGAPRPLRRAPSRALLSRPAPARAPGNAHPGRPRTPGAGRRAAPPCRRPPRRRGRARPRPGARGARRARSPGGASRRAARAARALEPTRGPRLSWGLTRGTQIAAGAGRCDARGCVACSRHSAAQSGTARGTAQTKLGRGARGRGKRAHRAFSRSPRPQPRPRPRAGATSKPATPQPAIYTPTHQKWRSRSTFPRPGLAASAGAWQGLPTHPATA
jgi:hypothetical protein